jgi:ppGpp synthetase/RelA/SpoT-type nucleotidyltranferase
MPLNETIIVEAVDRYWREYDRYLKLAKRVEEICRDDVVEGNTIRGQVTFRAKDPKRFEGKLKKYLSDAEEANALNSVDDVFDRVSDLAGVRVATYEERDRAKVVTAITKAFVGKDEAPIDIDIKDAERGFYRATHCQVYLPESELVGTYDNLKGLGCEIQVSSMLAHVWNEIEHDLRYKPQMGLPSRRENEYLDQLGHLLTAGDGIIMHLLEEAEKRHHEDTDPFADVFDFVARMRNYLPELPDLGSHANQVLDELVAFGYDTPAALKQYFKTPRDVDSAKTELATFSKWLADTRDGDWDLDASTSDVLLMHLLRTRVDDILARHPRGPGKGHPSRLTSVALRYKRVLDIGAAILPAATADAPAARVAY